MFRTAYIVWIHRRLNWLHKQKITDFKVNINKTFIIQNTKVLVRTTNSWFPFFYRCEGALKLSPTVPSAIKLLKCTVGLIFTKTLLYVVNNKLFSQKIIWNLAKLLLFSVLSRVLGRFCCFPSHCYLYLASSRHSLWSLRTS